MRYGKREQFGSTVFGAISEKGEKDYSIPAADVTLVHGGFKNTHMNYTHPTTGEPAYGPTGHSPAFPVANTRKPEQGVLLRESPSTISSAFADKSMRGTVPTLLGMAVNKANQIGTGLQADSSLSRHSSPLAKKGLASGALQPNPSNPTGRRNNGYRLGRHVATSRGVVENLFTEADPAEVQAGKTTIRGLLRAPKPTTEKEVTKAMDPSQRRQAAFINATETPDPGRPHAGVSESQHEWSRRDAGGNTARGNALDLGPRFDEKGKASQRKWLLAQQGDTGPAPFDEEGSVSPSKHEWQTSAPKPSKRQKPLF